MSPRGAYTALGAVACGLTLAGMGAWAQPRHEPPARHGSPRTDAGVTAGSPRRGTTHRDAGVDVALRPPTHGTVDTAATQRVLAAHATAAQRCYESGLAHDPTLHGRVVVRLRVEPDGTSRMDVRLVMRTEQGQLFYMQYSGVRHGPADVIAALGRGEAVDPSSYYFRIAVKFETADPGLAWLNRVVAVGVGQRPPAGPTYDVYVVR